MPIITLTSDFGNKDYFVAIVKEKILNSISDVKIIDISHNIDLYNLSETAYNLMGVLHHFSAPAYHFVLVDAEIECHSHFVLAKKANQKIICANNGLASLIAIYHDFDELFLIEKPSNATANTELYLDIIAKYEKGILNNKKVSLDEIKKVTELYATYHNQSNLLKGAIIYEDHFGNLVTNIKRSTFEKYRANRPFKFRNERTRFTIDRIQNHYEDFKLKENEDIKNKEGAALLMFNDQDFLQISIYKSKENGGGIPRNLLGLKYRDIVYFEFIE